MAFKIVYMVPNAEFTWCYPGDTSYSPLKYFDSYAGLELAGEEDCGAGLYYYICQFRMENGTGASKFLSYLKDMQRRTVIFRLRTFV